MLTRPTLRARKLSAIVFATTCLVASPARADEAKTSSLAWVRMPGSESCVPSQDLARAVEARLGRDVFVPTSRADLSIEGRVEPLPGRKGHRAVILVRGGNGETLGERTIEDKDPTCARLTEPLSLVIALMIDPEAASRPRKEETLPPAPSPPPPPPSPPPPPPAPSPERRIEPARPHRDMLRFEGTVISTVVTGLTPGAAVGFGGAGLLQLPRIPVALRGAGSIYVPVTAERNGVSSAFDLGLLSGYVCPTTYLGERVRLLGCIGSMVGVARARAVAPSVSDDDYRPMWNIALEGRAAVQIVGPLVLAASAGAAVAVFRKDLRLERAPGDAVVVHSLAPVSFLAELGIGVVVP